MASAHPLKRSEILEVVSAGQRLSAIISAALNSDVYEYELYGCIFEGVPVDSVFYPVY